MRSLVITSDVAARVERVLAESSLSRIEPVQRVSGNPLGVEVRRWGDAIGTLVADPTWYYRYFNALKNVGPDDHVAVDEGLAWLRGHGVACRLTVSAFNANEGFLEGLSRRGLRPVQFLSVLAGVPEEDWTPPPDGVTIRELGGDDFEDFLEVWIPSGLDRDRSMLEKLVRAEFTDWRGYVAVVNGAPAAVATLRIAHGVGVLAAGSTRPAFRGRGCQTALVRRRVADARTAGCDLVLAQASPNSTSQRNLERIGFRTAYTELILADSLVQESS